MSDRSILWTVLALSLVTTTIAIVGAVKATRAKMALESSTPYRLAEKLGLVQ